MLSRADLQALIERVEKATGPDRELDADIYEALGYEVKRRSERVEEGWRVRRTVDWRYLDGSRWLAMDYLTASVDADLALLERVLPGWRAEIRWGDWPQHIERHDATLWNNDTSKRESVFGVSANAATLPLAIIAATLRAMQTQENE